MGEQKDLELTIILLNLLASSLALQLFYLAQEEEIQNEQQKQAEAETVSNILKDLELRLKKLENKIYGHYD